MKFSAKVEVVKISFSPLSHSACIGSLRYDSPYARTFSLIAQSLLTDRSEPAH